MESRKSSSLHFLIPLLCGFVFCQAQNKESVYSHKESRNEEFQTVMVDLKHYVELDIATSTERGFYITDEKQSGEYKNALVLNAQVVNDTLFITDPLNPTFQFPQDKLSAHKITDTKAVLILPQYKNLFLNLPDANLNLEGNYKNVILNIHSGKVILQKLIGNMQATSVNANVQGENLKDYFFEASSRNGNVEIKYLNRNSRYLLKVESINGDIQLN